MKKRNLLILACGALLASATLTACSSNQSKVGIGIDQVKTVGFMQLANENKERIWFEVIDTSSDDEISKDDKINRVIVIKNGKADFYHTIESKLSDFKDLSDEEIINKIKQLDRDYVSSIIKDCIGSINGTIKRTEESLSEAREQGYEIDEQFYVDDININKQRISALENLKYEDIAHLYSNFELYATVETDSSGNSVISEEIGLPIDFSFSEDSVFSDESSALMNLNDFYKDLYGTNELGYPVQGDIYSQNYKGYGTEHTFFITSSLDDSVNLGLDTLDTKNVTEE
ncbi:TPA: hypothetical protein U2B95_000424 [Streptococcus suis]|nr:hypothetical protein [Streptococcus suis]